MTQLCAPGYTLRKVQASVQYLHTMFIAALFTIVMAYTWRTVECWSAMKNKIMFAEKSMEPENQVKQNKPGLERQILHVFPHMENMDFFLIYLRHKNRRSTV